MRVSISSQFQPRTPLLPCLDITQSVLPKVVKLAPKKGSLLSSGIDASQHL